MIYLPPNISNYFATSRLSCLYLFPVSIFAICTIILCLSRRTVLNQCSMLNHIHVPDSTHYVFMTNHLTASSLLGLSLLSATSISSQLHSTSGGCRDSLLSSPISSFKHFNLHAFQKAVRKCHVKAS